MLFPGRSRISSEESSSDGDTTSSSTVLSRARSRRDTGDSWPDVRSDDDLLKEKGEHKELKNDVLEQQSPDKEHQVLTELKDGNRIAARSTESSPVQDESSLKNIQSSAIIDTDRQANDGRNTFMIQNPVNHALQQDVNIDGNLVKSTGSSDIALELLSQTTANKLLASSQDANNTEGPVKPHEEAKEKPNQTTVNKLEESIDQNLETKKALIGESAVEANCGVSEKQPEKQEENIKSAFTVKPYEAVKQLLDEKFDETMEKILVPVQWTLDEKVEKLEQKIEKQETQLESKKALIDGTAVEVNSGGSQKQHEKPEEKIENASTVKPPEAANQQPEHKSDEKGEKPVLTLDSKKATITDSSVEPISEPSEKVHENPKDMMVKEPSKKPEEKSVHKLDEKVEAHGEKLEQNLEPNKILIGDPAVQENLTSWLEPHMKPEDMIEKASTVKLHEAVTLLPEEKFDEKMEKILVQVEWAPNEKVEKSEQKIEKQTTQLEPLKVLVDDSVIEAVSGDSEKQHEKREDIAEAELVIEPEEAVRQQLGVKIEWKPDENLENKADEQLEKSGKKLEPKKVLIDGTAVEVNSGGSQKQHEKPEEKIENASTVKPPEAANQQPELKPDDKLEKILDQVQRTPDEKGEKLLVTLDLKKAPFIDSAVQATSEQSEKLNKNTRDMMEKEPSKKPEEKSVHKLDEEVEAHGEKLEQNLEPNKILIGDPAVQENLTSWLEPRMKPEDTIEKASIVKLHEAVTLLREEKFDEKMEKSEPKIEKQEKRLEPKTLLIGNPAIEAISRDSEKQHEKPEDKVMPALVMKPEEETRKELDVKTEWKPDESVEDKADEQLEKSEKKPESRKALIDGTAVEVNSGGSQKLDESPELKSEKEGVGKPEEAREQKLRTKVQSYADEQLEKLEEKSNEKLEAMKMLTSNTAVEVSSPGSGILDDKLQEKPEMEDIRKLDGNAEKKPEQKKTFMWDLGDRVKSGGSEKLQEEYEDEFKKIYEKLEANHERSLDSPIAAITPENVFEMEREPTSAVLVNEDELMVSPVGFGLLPSLGILELEDGKTLADRHQGRRGEFDEQIMLDKHLSASHELGDKGDVALNASRNPLEDWLSAHSDKTSDSEQRASVRKDNTNDGSPIEFADAINSYWKNGDEHCEAEGSRTGTWTSDSSNDDMNIGSGAHGNYLPRKITHEYVNVKSSENHTGFDDMKDVAVSNADNSPIVSISDKSPQELGKSKESLKMSVDQVVDNMGTEKLSKQHDPPVNITISNNSKMPALSTFHGTHDHVTGTVLKNVWIKEGSVESDIPAIPVPWFYKRIYPTDGSVGRILKPDEWRFKGNSADDTIKSDSKGRPQENVRTVETYPSLTIEKKVSAQPDALLISTSSVNKDDSVGSGNTLSEPAKSSPTIFKSEDNLGLLKEKSPSIFGPRPGIEVQQPSASNNIQSSAWNVENHASSSSWKHSTSANYGVNPIVLTEEEVWDIANVLRMLEINRNVSPGRDRSQMENMRATDGMQFQYPPVSSTHQFREESQRPLDRATVNRSGLLFNSDVQPVSTFSVPKHHFN